MLDTTSMSNNEFPLFGTSSSFGMDIVIQRPLATESYSWSDLSIVVQDDSTTLSYTRPTRPQQASSSCSHQRGFDSCHSAAPLAFSESQSTLSSTSTANTANTTDSIHSDKKSVRFAPSPKVRTYSVVLGDHPMCDDGLSIELGWEYSDDDGGSSDEKVQNFRMSDPQQRTCQKRSYLSRKQLLLDVAGCTKEELEERSRELEARKSQIERQRIFQEDYYYCLAFGKPR